jgi:hypothetical protein
MSNVDTTNDSLYSRFMTKTSSYTLGDILSFFTNVLRYVKATTNNPVSSRGHLLIDIQVMYNNDDRQHIFIGDFAGLENKFDDEDLKTVHDFLHLANNNKNITEPFYMTEMIQDQNTDSSKISKAKGTSTYIFSPIKLQTINKYSEEYINKYIGNGFTIEINKYLKANKSELQNIDTYKITIPITTYTIDQIFKIFGVTGIYKKLTPRLQIEYSNANLSIRIQPFIKTQEYIESILKCIYFLSDTNYDVDSVLTTLNNAPSTIYDDINKYVGISDRVIDTISTYKAPYTTIINKEIDYLQKPDKSEVTLQYLIDNTDFIYYDSDLKLKNIIDKILTRLYTDDPSEYYNILQTISASISGITNNNILENANTYIQGELKSKLNSNTNNELIRHINSANLDDTHIISIIENLSKSSDLKTEYNKLQHIYAGTFYLYQHLHKRIYITPKGSNTTVVDSVNGKLTVLHTIITDDKFKSKFKLLDTITYTDKSPHTFLYKTIEQIFDRISNFATNFITVIISTKEIIKKKNIAARTPDTLNELVDILSPIFKSAITTMIKKRNDTISKMKQNSMNKVSTTRYVKKTNDLTEDKNEFMYNVISNCILYYMESNKIQTLPANSQINTIIPKCKPYLDTLKTELIKRYASTLYGIEICRIRSNEGKHINASVFKTCNEIIDIVNYKNKGSAYNSPDYIQQCITSYCMREPFTCLATSNVANLKPYSQIMDSRGVFNKMYSCIYGNSSTGNSSTNQTMPSFYNDITLCIMCVFNITKDDKVPKNFYLDIYDLKREYMDYVYTLNSYIKYDELPSESKTVQVNAIAETIVEKLKLSVEGIVQKTKEFNEMAKTYAKDVTGKLANYYTTLDNIANLLTTNATRENFEKFKNIVNEFIQQIDINNNSTPIGTITFIDELSKYNQTNINCRLGNTDIENLGHKNMYGLIEYSKFSGGNVLDEIYSSNKSNSHSKSKRRHTFNMNKTYKQYK